MASRGCYICRPEDPDAPTEGCSECERRFLVECYIPLLLEGKKVTVDEAQEMVKELEHAE